MTLHAIDTEKRQFSRVEFNAAVILDNGTKKWESKLLDISLKGALILTPENWQADNKDNYQLSIKLDNSDIEIDMDVTLAHAENDHLGFHCEHIDIDSIAALRRLVELNLGNEEQLEREVSKMLR